jgi:hypothetical protein
VVRTHLGKWYYFSPCCDPSGRFHLEEPSREPLANGFDIVAAADSAAKAAQLS